jgi:O-antigen ligase
LNQATLTVSHEAANRALGATLSSLSIWLGVFLSGFVLFEPAPYELFVALLIGLWTITGALTIPRSVTFLLVTMIVFNMGGIISITQMEDLRNTPLYIASSLFLSLSAVFFASLIAQQPQRLALMFNAWTTAAVLTSLVAIAGYFGLVPDSADLTLYGRAKGFFEDPNVFAPYLTLPTLYSVYLLLTRPLRLLLPVSAVAAVLLLATFLSFSRAAWGMLLVSCMMLVAALFLTSRSGKFRMRIILLSIFAVAGAAAVLMIVLQIESVRSLFLDRAQLLQDYDASRFGRFERHLMGFMLATQKPFGIGPLEFGYLFGEDTHNIWLKALFDYSWLGFAAYLTMTMVTLAAGFRILFRDRPWRPFLLCAYIVYFGHVIIGNVIDTDHWRHFYLLLGIIWGCIALEAQHMRGGAVPVRQDAFSRSR